MANTQPNRSYENVRAVKSNVVNVAREMQQATNKIKQQANSLTEAIRAKKAELKAALQPAAQQEVVVAPVVEEGIPEHIKVAIIGAITAYYFENNKSNCDFIVRKIKRF